ncbi:MAG: hypothetical protein QUV08_12455 [Parasphingorhabdus sp.]|nr:hypothetical protein [Parasphingorhabdus sp.]
MSYFLFLMSLGSADQLKQIEDCKAAVSGNLGDAAIACATTGQTVDLWNPDASHSDACIAALKAGEITGQNGPKLAAVFRDGLIRDFNKKMDLCENPGPKDEPKKRDIIQLWD